MAQEANVRVLVADAQFLFADALATCLGDVLILDVCTRRPTAGIDLLEAVDHAQPSVVLVDYWLSEFEGPVATALLLARHPTIKVIVLAWFHGPAQVQAALDAGAVGFLPKSVKLGQVVAAVLRADSGERPVFAEQLTELESLVAQPQYPAEMVRSGLASLTVQELRVLRLLAAGLTVDDVAERLDIVTGTVRSHVHNVLAKTDSRSQLEAVSTARAYGLAP